MSEHNTSLAQRIAASDNYRRPGCKPPQTANGVGPTTREMVAALSTIEAALLI